MRGSVSACVCVWVFFSASFAFVVSNRRHYGGGGGGGGVDGSGGGGGSSWANLTALFGEPEALDAGGNRNSDEPAAPGQLVVAFANASLVTVAWAAVTVFDDHQRRG